MKIYNDGLPEEVFELMKLNFYTGKRSENTYSTTEIIKPVKEVLLNRRHYDEIEQPASSQMWKVFGSAIHAMLEKLPIRDGIYTEERINQEIDGIILSGQYDRIVDLELRDYKVTKTGTVSFGGRDEWKQQFSIYKWLFWKKHDIELKNKALAIPILRDWDDKKLHWKNYPQAAAVVFPVELMSLKETEQYIKDKVSEIHKYYDTPDDELPNCSDEDRWKRIDKNTGKAVYNKCKKYCNAYKFCSQAKHDEKEEL